MVPAGPLTTGVGMGWVGGWWEAGGAPKAARRLSGTTQPHSDQGKCGVLRGGGSVESVWEWVMGFRSLSKHLWQIWTWAVPGHGLILQPLCHTTYFILNIQSSRINLSSKEGNTVYFVVRLSQSLLCLLLFRKTDINVMCFGKELTAILSTFGISLATCGKISVLDFVKLAY